MSTRITVWNKAYWTKCIKQDGLLAPAYFSPNYKYFDQHLQTVKNETTALNLVFEGFLPTSILPLNYILYAKEGVSRFSVEICFCLTEPEKFVGEPFCVSEKFWYQKILCIGGIRGSTTVFRSNINKVKKCR